MEYSGRVAMTVNALSTEAIALTEKKMDVALDDIIKMSKKASFKGKPASRTSNKSQRFMNDRRTRCNSQFQRFMNSRSSIRQGVLAQRRTSFKGNQFPVTTEAARRAVVSTIRSRVVYPGRQRFAAVSIRRNTGDGNIVGKDEQKPKTLDALFSDMKERRIRTMTQQMARRCRQSFRWRYGGGGGRQQQHRGHTGAASGGSGARTVDRFRSLLR